MDLCEGSVSRIPLRKLEKNKAQQSAGLKPMTSWWHGWRLTAVQAPGLSLSFVLNPLRKFFSMFLLDLHLVRILLLLYIRLIFLIFFLMWICIKPDSELSLLRFSPLIPVPFSLLLNFPLFKLATAQMYLLTDWAHVASLTCKANVQSSTTSLKWNYLV